MDMSSRVSKAGSTVKSTGRNLGSGIASAGKRVTDSARSAGQSVTDNARKAGSKLGSTTRKAKDTARSKVAQSPILSPDPATNIAIADILVRAGGRLLRHTVERTLLSSVYDKEKARNLISGRSMKKTLINTAIARVATKSVPGALIVGGGYLVKALLDRQKGKRAARLEGQAEVDRQAAEGAKD